MPSSDLTVGEVFAHFAPGDPNPTYVVGEGLVWSDNSDDTFGALFTTEPGAYTGGLVAGISGAVPGALDHLDIGARTEFSFTNVLGEGRTLYLEFYDGEPELYGPGGAPLMGVCSFISFAPLGTREWLTSILSAVDLVNGYTMAGVKDAVVDERLRVAARMGAPGVDGTEAVAVFEMFLIAHTATPTVLAARRKTGREDHLGIGAGRIYPPPKSVQFSRRRAGGYI